jgi:enediyne polyketide synthase
MKESVAIVGMACCYPDARRPAELWENCLAGRRAFRRIPAERLSLDDYLSSDKAAPDKIYAAEAALIEGYEFDRMRYRIAGSTFRSADLAHWLALDIAAQSLDDAGFPEGEGLPKESTGVFLGNTLTGEFSRANTLRLRWPYVRRVLQGTLAERGWAAEEIREVVRRCEELYKEPFPAVGEDTLAGNLSNTIAGRICNHFDFKGAGYTVDGACASSLLAVATACSALAAGDLDVALAGGVDLSIDPFELVGFAKAGALSPDGMRVYDVRSSGFLPGEGCGFIVLMRHGEAVQKGCKIHAVIPGWGISSDGRGAITRPEMEGQLLALRRAYKRAGFGIETVSYFEGHGTGTSVGDTTELKTLSQARRDARASARAVIGSIKANIGHTKAAAGMAGLIKATLALENQILPPTTGCERPHAELSGADAALKPLKQGEVWPADCPLRAGVSAMGFGGINTHVVLESVAPRRPGRLDAGELALLASAQDAELFLLSARDRESLLGQVNRLLQFASRISLAELSDLAATLQARLAERDGSDGAAPAIRAAVVASTPQELAARLEILSGWLLNEVGSKVDAQAGVFLGSGQAARVGFLFPGQASPVYLDGGACARRFMFVRSLYTGPLTPSAGANAATEVAQPAIITAEVAGLRLMEAMGIRAEVAVGHSLGEVAALHWAGAFDEAAALRIAGARASAMNRSGGAQGSMASIKSSRQTVATLLNGDPLVIACLNAPDQTVVSGAAAALTNFVARAQAKGYSAMVLPVSHAFHSPLLAPAVPLLAESLSAEAFDTLRGKVVSTVTGSPIAPDESLRELLYRQLVAPVRFIEAAEAAAADADWFVEVGPGHVLTGLASEFLDKPVVALDIGGESLRGLLNAVGAAYAMGAPVKHEALFADRMTRPFDLDWQPRFFANPCESAPLVDLRTSFEQPPAGMPTNQIESHQSAAEAGTDLCDRQTLDAPNTLELVRHMVATRVELPPAAVGDDDRLLGDLHLNSIAVGQLVAEAARHLQLTPPAALLDYSAVTLADLAQALDEGSRAGTLAASTRRHPAGVDTWARCFTVELIEQPRRARQAAAGESNWQVIAPPDHPFANRLREAFAACAGRGVVLALPTPAGEREVGLLLEGARAVLAAGEGARFVMVEHGGTAAAFARTLYLEAPWVTTCVVNVPPDHPRAVEWAVAEAQAADGFTEAHYDRAGKRRSPALKLLPEVGGCEAAALGPEDVILVTGGGKGIAAECALALARDTGVRLALVGRSRPGDDADLSANLERMAALGIVFRYVAADVVDAEAVRAAVGQIESTLGPVTAILHGAGANVPTLLQDLDENTFLETLNPKLRGARNVLAAIQPQRVRFFITFGSLIARTGMRGEADYAIANQWLTALAEQWQADHPHCRCLAIEWSIWSGVGMGQRLGRMDVLVHQGITPIPVDEGVRLFKRLLAQDAKQVATVVSGRFGQAPTLGMAAPELLFGRFLERPRLHYPGIELIVESELSVQTDPYLEDHVLDGDRIFPAVMGLEAMAQVAMALVETEAPPAFEEVRFNRAIVVPGGSPATISIAALVRGPGLVEVVVRSDQTDFQVDHFRALCRFNVPRPAVETPAAGAPDFAAMSDGFPLIDLRPAEDMYGELLFQGGRFARLRGYRRMGSTGCEAEIEERQGDWFGPYLPGRLVLGDAGRRDATIHALQACVPNATLLPIAIERLVIGGVSGRGPVTLFARERSREGDCFTYDLEVKDADGLRLEAWRGLRLITVSRKSIQDRLAGPLVGVAIERALRDWLPGEALSVVIEPGGDDDRRTRSDRAMRRALGKNTEIWRRPDGRPETAAGDHLSASHSERLSLAVAGPRRLGCDLEAVRARTSSLWRDLLGHEYYQLARVIMDLAGEDMDTAATRAWGAGECLKKSGAPDQSPLTFDSVRGDGCVVLASGGARVATFAVSLKGAEGRHVAAILLAARTGTDDTEQGRQARCDHARL